MNHERAANRMLALLLIGLPGVTLAAPSASEVGSALWRAGRVTLVGESGTARVPLAVHIESDNPRVELFRIAGTAVGTGYSSGGTVVVQTTFFETICRTPCDEKVDGHISNRYFLGGDGVSVTDTFDFANYKEGVTVKVRAGSSGWRTLGYVMSYLGGTGVLVGGTFFGVGTLLSSASSSTTPTTFQTVGLISGGIGLALLVPGIVLAIVNGTTYEILPATGDSSAPKVPSQMSL